MGSLYNIFCDSCNYQAIHITTGDGKHAIAVCTQCREIRNPELVLFRFELPRCAVCGNVLQYDMPEFCLRCNAPLRYEQVMHFKLIERDRHPEVGALVHAYFDRRRDKWDIPNLWLWHGKLTVAAVPEADANRVIEARVANISKDPSGWISSIDAAFVRATAIEPPKPR